MCPPPHCAILQVFLSLIRLLTLFYSTPKKASFSSRSLYTSNSFLLAWSIIVYAAAKSLQSCPTLCNPMDCSPPGFSVPGILQVRTLEWVAISFSNAWKWKVKVKSLSRVWPSATPWTAALQAPLSIGFSRQEYWSGVPLPSPFIHPNLPSTVLIFPSGCLFSSSFSPHFESK